MTTPSTRSTEYCTEQSTATAVDFYSLNEGCAITADIPPYRTNLVQHEQLRVHSVWLARTSLPTAVAVESHHPVFGRRYYTAVDAAAGLHMSTRM